MLAAGTRIGAYGIVSLLGAGGMGEVYRARDPKLKRDVALKILPDAFAADPERLARFQREAEVLASLNHPHIAHVYGIEDGDRADDTGRGVRALVMELVEGETLADRIGRGRIPLDDALPMAKQIADALEAAHERGIVHRDLKPANIKVTPEGTVKVLDFGLAKALDTAVATEDSPGVASFSPTTISPAVTLRGVILGTAAYMSPEQAKGRFTDRRTDIWAFGCVLFEMLSGMRAFAGEDVAETMVAILSRDPDWAQLPADAAAVRPLVARCLRRDPRQRLQAIGDARIQLEELASGVTTAVSTSAPARGPSMAPRLMIAFAASILATAAVMWAVLRPVPVAPALPVRFEIASPSGPPLSINSADRNVAISPDGRFIVYRAGTPPQLMVRAIDGREGRPLEGTANARVPFFSPDGQWVGFFDGTRLRKAPVGGGPPITICSSHLSRGASWGEDGTIVFTTSDTATGLLRVSAAGGEPTVLTTPDARQGERDHGQPLWLPDGSVLFTIVSSSPDDPRRIALLDLRTGARTILVRGGSQPEYLASGHLLYANEGNLLAVRFDLDRRAVQGDPVSVVPDLLMNRERGDFGHANYVVSRQGTLLYIEMESTDTPSRLVWVDRTGRETPIQAPPRSYRSVQLSPDGRDVAVEIADEQRDIHVLNLEQGTLTRLAPGPSVESRPVWTADGRRIVFSSRRDGVSNLYVQAADGAGSVRRLTSGPDPQLPAWVAPDGRGILGSEISPKTAGDIVWFPLDGSSGPSQADTAAGSRALVERLVQSVAIDYWPDVSVDGRYVAYQSNEAGQDEIYVRLFPNVNDGVWSVSAGGGIHPVWAKSGRELYYLDATSMLVAVPVQMSTTAIRFGNPTRLFQITGQGQYATRRFDVAADGRFLVVKPNAPERPPGLVVVVNWIEELQAKLPTRP